MYILCNICRSPVWQVEATEWWQLVTKDERVNRRAYTILRLTFGCSFSCPLFLHVNGSFLERYSSTHAWKGRHWRGQVYSSTDRLHLEAKAVGIPALCSVKALYTPGYLEVVSLISHVFNHSKYYHQKRRFQIHKPPSSTLAHIPLIWTLTGWMTEKNFFW